MKNFVLALLMFVLMLFAISTANATPRGFRGSDFDAGFQAGARAARNGGGHVRNVRAPVVEIERGFFGGVRGVRVR